MTTSDLPAALLLAVVVLLIFSLLFQVKRVTRFLQAMVTSDRVGFRLFRIMGILVLSLGAWKSLKALLGHPPD